MITVRIAGVVELQQVYVDGKVETEGSFPILESIMNILNRLIVIVLSLLVLIGSVLTLLIMGRYITPGQISPNGRLQRQWEFFSHLNAADGQIVVAICIVLIVVTLLLLLLELRPARRNRRAVPAPRYAVDSHES